GGRVLRAAQFRTLQAPVMEGIEGGEDPVLVLENAYHEPERSADRRRGCHVRWKMTDNMSTQQTARPQSTIIPHTSARENPPRPMPVSTKALITISPRPAMRSGRPTAFSSAR